MKLSKSLSDLLNLFTAAPKIVRDIKRSAKKELLRSVIHEHVDNTIEMYGDVIIDIGDKIDKTLIDNLVTDVQVFIEKWKQPIMDNGKIISESLTSTITKFAERQNNTGKKLHTIITEIGEENEWEFVMAEKKKNEERLTKYIKQISESYNEEIDDSTLSEEEKSNAKSQLQATFIRKEDETFDAYFNRVMDYELKLTNI